MLAPRRTARLFAARTGCRAFASSSDDGEKNTAPAGPGTSTSTTMLPPFADECLRGIGQVVFCNSAKSGGVILAAMTAGDPLLGALGALGAVTATATARVCGSDRSAIADGLFGYNGAWSAVRCLRSWGPTP